MSVHKRTGFLSQNWISELVWDIESHEAGAPSYNNSEDEGGCEDEPQVSHLRSDQPTTRGHMSSSSFSSNASDEKEVFRMGHVNRPKHHPLHSEHDPLASQ